MAKKFKAMIVSVGGASAPVLYSLNHSKPDYICFFASRESRKILEQEILPNLSFKPIYTDLIITPNAELLTDCYSELSRRLSYVLEKWEVNPSEICIDYTGGTKTMSVALVLATIENSCCYSYVGGDERSKGGVGVVVDGKEKMWFLDNPWDEIALSEKKEAAVLFNKARYASAAEIFENCMGRVSKEKKPFFKALVDMVRGYEFWDGFKHQQAKSKLYRSRDWIATYALMSTKKEINTLLKKIDENLEFLENLSQSQRSYFLDLLANAKRRAELEKKFDDAVARLYRAIEVLAQVELRQKYNINTSNADADILPENLRIEFNQKYLDPQDRKIKIPLFPAYRLLNEFKHPLGENFFKFYEKGLRSLLAVRNGSILGHGFNPVKEENYKKLFEVVLEFSETGEEELPEFPTLKI